MDSLPAETAISNSPSALLIYRDAKSFIYIESDKKLKITLDGSQEIIIEPLSSGTNKKPGIYLSTAVAKSAVIENLSQEFASIFYVTAE